jgi:hypothetical protein
MNVEVKIAEDAKVKIAEDGESEFALHVLCGNSVVSAN